MENQENLIEPLLARVEEYGKTSFELLKLKSLIKTADVTSTITSRLLLVITIAIAILTFNVAVGFWLGEILGKIYYGFLVVTLFYVLAGIILYFLHPVIKIHVSNSVITKMLN